MFAYFFFIISIEISNENSKRISYFLGTLFTFLQISILHLTLTKILKMNKYFLYYLSFNFLINSVVLDIILIKFEIDTATFFIAKLIFIIFNFLGQKYVVFKK